MKAFITSCAILVAAAIVVAAFFVGQQIPFAQQWPLFEALRSTASIIFAVVGAWFAIIYPERLRATFRSEDTPPVEPTAMQKLFTPIVHSTVILSIILLLGILAPIFSATDLARNHKEIARGLSYAALSMLTLWQIVTVLMTLNPADMLKRRADLDRRKQEALGTLPRRD